MFNGIYIYCTKALYGSGGAGEAATGATLKATLRQSHQGRSVNNVRWKAVQEIKLTQDLMRPSQRM